MKKIVFFGDKISGWSIDAGQLSSVSEPLFEREESTNDLIIKLKISLINNQSFTYGWVAKKAEYDENGELIKYQADDLYAAKDEVLMNVLAKRDELLKAWEES